MLDRLQLGPDDLALAALKAPDPQHIKPEQYKDAFTNPVNFQEAYNHPESFQRNHWRVAIKKEFSKINERKVWRKLKSQNCHPIGDSSRTSGSLKLKGMEGSELGWWLVATAKLVVLISPKCPVQLSIM
jgi:hypothetical protein